MRVQFIEVGGHTDTSAGGWEGQDLSPLGGSERLHAYIR
jgi:hypothetical protein